MVEANKQGGKGAKEQKSVSGMVLGSQLFLQVLTWNPGDIERYQPGVHLDKPRQVGGKYPVGGVVHVIDTNTGVFEGTRTKVIFA